ncbi:MAG: CE1 family esterase [Algiphilus sp.]
MDTPADEQGGSAAPDDEADESTEPGVPQPSDDAPSANDSDAASDSDSESDAPEPAGDSGTDPDSASETGGESAESGTGPGEGSDPGEETSDGDADAGDEPAPEGEDADVANDDAANEEEADDPAPEIEPAPMVTERRRFGGRPYLVHRPSPVRPGAPVVLLLHAATEDMNSVFDERRPSAAWKMLASDDQFILVAPNGRSPEGESDSDTAYWNDCADNSRQTRLNSTADDIGFLSTLIDRVVAEYQADPSAVYVYGLSNGGSMALRLAQEAPERVAGAVSVLGLVAEDGECVTPATPVPVMLMHGTEDPLARYEDGRGPFRDYLLGAEASYRFWLELNGVVAEPERRRVFADLDASDESTVACLARGTDQRRVQLCTMDGAGHLDPSITRFYGSGSGPFGRQNRDIESAVLAWAFLRDVAVGSVVAPD